MKILIIEDIARVAYLMAQTLEGVGEVVICTESPFMPKREEALRLIAEADVIFLDNELGTNYKGKDLYPYCEGKKVIGISSDVAFGTSYYCRDKKDMMEIPKEREFFGSFARKAIAE